MTRTQRDQLNAGEGLFRISRPILLPVLAFALFAGAATAQVRSVQETDRSIPIRPGIYTMVGTQAPEELLPTITSSVRLKGLAGTLFTFGLAKMRTVARLAGAKARTRVDNNGTFVFRAPAVPQPVPHGGQLLTPMAHAASPAEFALLKMEVDEDERSFRFGRFGIGSTGSGIPAGTSVPFTISTRAGDLYEVSLGQLAPGEYAWVWLGSTAQAGTPFKVHDFGVDP